MVFLILLNGIASIIRSKSEVKGKLASLIGRHQNQVYLDKFPPTKIEEVKNIVHHICKYRGYNEQPKISMKFLFTYLKTY